MTNGSASPAAARPALARGGRPRPDAVFWALVAVAAGLRVTVAVLKGVVGTDEALYLVLGRNLVSEGHYTLQGDPHLLFPPLFPAVAGTIDRVLGSTPATLVWSSRIAFVLFGTALLFPVWFLAARVHGEKAARWAAALVAVYPALTAYVASWFWGSMSEPLFLFLAAGGLALALAAFDGGRIAPHAAAGLAFGLAYLTRPEGIAYFVLAGLLLASRIVRPAAKSVEDRARRGAVLGLAAYAAAFLACAAPYVAYLHEHTGSFSPSAKGGTVLQMAFAMLGKDPLHRARTLDTLAYERLGFEVRHGGEEGPRLGFADESKRGGLGPTIVEVIADDPKLFVLHALRNCGSLVAGLLSREVLPAPLILLVGAAFFARPWDRGRIVGELFLAAGIAPLAGLVVFGILPRFLFPAVPILLIWVARGIVEVERWAAASAPRRPWMRGTWRLACLALVVALGAASLAKPLKARIARSEPVEYVSAGEWMRENLPDEAVLVARKPEIAFYAWRRMVPLPFADLAGVLDFARSRGATHLVLDRYSCYGARPELRPLFDDPGVPPGLDLVHRDTSAGEGRPILVFRIL